MTTDGLTADELERRLRAAMGPPAQPTGPDPAVLRSIRHRAFVGTSRAERRRDAGAGAGLPLRDGGGVYRAVLAAGVAAALLAAGFWLAHGGPPTVTTTQQPTAPIGAGVDRPAPPGWWWLGAVVAGGAGVTWWSKRRRDRLTVIGVGLIALAAVVTVAATLPALRAGAELARRAPTIEGYELVDADLQLKGEGPPPYRLATLAYRPGPGTPAPGPVSPFEPLEPWATGLGFDRYGLNVGERCLFQPTPPGGGLEGWDGDVYCLMAVEQGRLVVSAALSGGRPGWPQGTGVPLALVGVVFLVLARVDERRSVPRPVGQQLRYAGALSLLGLMLTLLSLTAYDLVRVGSFGFAADCHWDDPGWLRCRDLIAAAIYERGVESSAHRLYYPILLMMDLVFVPLTWLAWRLASASGPGPRRRRLVLGLVIALGVALTFQIVFAQRFRVIGDYLE